ncbi:nitroreductase [Enterococcus canis]|uniref:Nitroreductase n=1 Tax=Enterococcus canis TaxID=214095 RepID=A0A1L8RIB1_9ENTE|nr:nitroreductase family protein [Enterococcus canis]OJG19496.1 nitroreductase [Enterococcus canis]
MEYQDLLETRFSVKAFSDKLVSREQIQQIAEAGRLAPSAGNYQPTLVYLLSEAKIKQIADTAAARVHPVFAKAKQAFVICYDKEREMRRPHDGETFGPTDSSIAATSMLYKLTDLGLGGVWIGWFDPQQVKAVLKLPDNLVVTALLPFGYPESTEPPAESTRERKPLTDFLRER